jgi:hypothetical protein
VQISFFDAVGEPKFICRSSQAKERVEWQADFYASCLLMPRKMIFSAWDRFFPDRRPRVLQPRTQIAHYFVEIPHPHASIGLTDDEALDRFCKPLAGRFFVSPVAMRIRLEKLGLLHRVAPLQRLLASR